MTGSPLCALPDSGYLTSLAADRAQFSFDRSDIMETTTHGDLQEREEIFVSAPSSPCTWALQDGQLFQRRKRSYSCPSSRPTSWSLPTRRSRSCMETDTTDMVQDEPQSSESQRSMGTQSTQTHPEDGLYCDGCLRIYANEVSRENAILPGTVPVAVVRPQALIQPAIQAGRHLAARRWGNFAVGRRIAAMADEFDRDYRAESNPNPLIDGQLLRMAVPLIQFANGAIVGAFIAVPLPAWANRVLRYAWRFFNP